MRKLISALSLLLVSASIAFAAPTPLAFTENYVDNTLASETKPEGTATGGGNDYICLEAGSDGSDDTYNDYGVFLTGGTGAGESLRIIDYDVAGGTCALYAQVDTNWATNPDATTTYEINIGSDSNNGLAEGIYGGANGARRQINYAIDGRTTGIRLNVLAGREYDVITAITNGYVAAGILHVLQGYGSTPGDGTRAILDGQSAIAVGIQQDRGGVIANFEIKGFTADGIYSTEAAADLVWIYNVKVHDVGDRGIEGDFGAAAWFVYHCEITNAANAIRLEDGGNVFYSNIHDNSSTGLDIDGGYVLFNIFDTNGADGIKTDGGVTYLLHNTVYNSVGDSLEILGGDYHYIVNNIFHTAGGWNINGAVNDLIFLYGYNSYFADTSGDDDGASQHFYDLGNNQTGDPDFVGADDFDLDTSTTLDNTGYCEWPGNAATGSLCEPGAVPYEETGGGGGSVTVGYGGLR